MRCVNRVCAGLAILLAMVFFAGCATASTETNTSRNPGLPEEVVTEDSLVAAVRTQFTPEALRAYTEHVHGADVGRFLGSGLVEGRGSFPIDAIDGGEGSAYAITLYCDPAVDVPYSVGLQRGDAYRQSMYVEGCPQGAGIDTISTPEHLFPDATGVTIDAGSRGRVIAVVYEVEEKQED